MLGEGELMEEDLLPRKRRRDERRASGLKKEPASVWDGIAFTESTHKLHATPVHRCLV